MALPAGIDTVTVTGAYSSLDGSVCKGVVTFTPQACQVKFADVPVTILGTITVHLAADGTFTVTLPASDATGADPALVPYEVTERLSCMPCDRTRTTTLTLAGSPYTMADLPAA
jgi:hypothetical protein